MNKLKISFIFFFLIIAHPGYSQESFGYLKNWQNLDLKIDHVFGISMEKTYTELLKEKTSVPVIVAVIDGGVDINHEDLKEVIYSNRKEISGNGKDDDGNGYVDDTHGWNFMGCSKGSFQYDNIGLVRLLRLEQKKSRGSVKSKQLQSSLDNYIIPLQSSLKQAENNRMILSAMIKRMDKDNAMIQEWKNYKYQNEEEEKMLIIIVKALKINPDFSIFKAAEEGKYWKLKYQLDYLLNIQYDPRTQNSEYKNKLHGNNDLVGQEPGHGTHVAGIIAADRNNNIGIKGVAKDAKIMALRAVPVGEAYDPDIANSIRYAVDNGAKVINLSLLTSSSPDKKLIDGAVRYAMKNDVLIIHGAGNDGKEQRADSYPNKRYLDGTEAEAWIEVGASGWKNDESLLGSFSTYGKATVDVFAPGVDIYSTWPNNKYIRLNGTSMAAPVVSGLAAEIRAYYPNLNAIQVKDIIMRSVVKPAHNVNNSSGESIYFSNLCKSEGIVNAYNVFETLIKEKLSK